jgi:hypothetical protein
MGPPSDYIDYDDIHPLFQFGNWDFDPGISAHKNAIWNEMKPALALVTKFLTTPEAYAWWFHAKYGKVQESDAHRHVIPSSESINYNEARKKFDAVLLELSNQISFY